MEPEILEPHAWQFLHSITLSYIKIFAYMSLFSTIITIHYPIIYYYYYIYKVNY